jgi:hypothetical protein
MATKKKSNARAWEIGAGITAATLAAAAGAYLLSDKKTKAKAKKWVGDARKEVAKRAKLAKKLSAKEYTELVNQAVKRYGSIQKMSGAEMLAAAQDLKGEWAKIQAHAKTIAKGKTKGGAKAKTAKKKSALKKKTAKKSRG